jgi:hypothetical protein
MEEQTRQHCPGPRGSVSDAPSISRPARRSFGDSDLKRYTKESAWKGNTGAAYALRERSLSPSTSDRRAPLRHPQGQGGVSFVRHRTNKIPGPLDAQAGGVPNAFSSNFAARGRPRCWGCAVPRDITNKCQAYDVPASENHNAVRI